LVDSSTVFWLDLSTTYSSVKSMKTGKNVDESIDRSIDRQQLRHSPVSYDKVPQTLWTSFDSF